MNWNTLSEQRISPRHRGKLWSDGDDEPAKPLSSIESDDLPRVKSSSQEVNRVLGGGLVPGSITLVAGEPGIGKSTLLLRLASDVATADGQALYVTGEESAAQIKLRANRMDIRGEDLFILETSNLDKILTQFDRFTPSIAVVDSIQTVYSPSIDSTAGTSSQTKESTRILMQWCKANNVPMIITGHVTKGGDVAGPKVLEHMVDVVLYMEGEPVSAWRLLKTVKNRFGSTNEVGIFEMTGSGLSDVVDPSSTFLAERHQESVGSVLVASLEGNRPLLVEIQALTNRSVLPTPRRVATGIDINRLLLICAVLTRRANLSLSNQDVIVNVTGGLKINEPAADLGTALAIASSLIDAPVSSGLAAVGEVGLSGEIRRVPQVNQRLNEVNRLGLEKFILPSSGNMSVLDSSSEVNLVPVTTLREALDETLAGPVYKHHGKSQTQVL